LSPKQRAGLVEESAGEEPIADIHSGAGGNHHKKFETIPNNDEIRMPRPKE
jgi:hypothetical protein